MSLNTYEMEGSIAFIHNAHYDLGSGNQMDSYNIENSGRQLPAYSFETQQDFGVTHPWSQRPNFRPVYNAELATGPTLDPSCSFRSEVLDDCAGARFYARALEFYLLENEHQSAEFSCPFAACTAQYKNPKSMLQHLKHCKNFAQGKFWCPTCLRWESFRLRSGKRCSWDKDHFARKLLQKSKSVFQSFGSNPSATQQKPNCTLCATCSAQLPDLWMQGDGNIAPFDQAQQPGSQFCELESISVASELSGDSSPKYSPSQSYPYPGFTRKPLVSELSSALTSPNGNSISTGISPSSSTHGEMAPTTRRHNFANILDKAPHRVARFYGETDASNHIMNQHCTSLYRNASTSHDLRALAPDLDASNSGSFATPSNLLPTLTHHTSFRNTPPKLRLETSQDLTVATPDIELFLHGITTSDHHSAMTKELSVTSLPTGIIDTSQPNVEVSLFGPFTSGDDPFAAQQLSSPSNDQSSPVSAISMSNSNSQSSHTGHLSEQDQLKCSVCAQKFKRKAYLRKHLKTHGARDRIPCHLCDEDFTRKDNRTSHLKRIHSVFTQSPSKRRRDSSDSIGSAPQPKRKGLRAE
ncbi:hypothetical protein E0Z10_g2411 [Xylaria hypoxylon]|uniref:C2H2-type domain-containing protein n=1 Tax=Xylaria hypoxylon TaxID=37992 RepID=A0A4Z0YQY1_9PEZI|nr:hypothetical protein E0Z10_g2411 [Xylaria hypoxylon]